MASSFKKEIIAGAVLASVLLVWGASIYVENKGVSRSSVTTAGEMIVYNGSMTAEDEALLSGLDTLPAPSLLVDDDLEDDPANHSWNTIQEGIDDARENDVIYVRKGIYRENIVIRKPLILIGEDNTDTIIDGGYNGDTVSIKADNVRVSGFSIINTRYRMFPDHEIRGETARGNHTWTPENFGGLFYDIDSDAGSEMLSAVVSGRQINAGDLTYTTAPQEIGFEYMPFGRYDVIGFMGEKYFAGYTVNSSISGNRQLNTLDEGRLHRVLLDENESRGITEGGTLPLGEGYSLRFNTVDEDKVSAVLLKNGSPVEPGRILKAGETYTYQPEQVMDSISSGPQGWSDMSELPVIAVHIESIPAGRGTNEVVVRGIFQISMIPLRLAAGDRFGTQPEYTGERFVYLNVSGVSSSGITLKNDNWAIYLSRNNETNIAGSFKIKVADSDTLRFFPLFEKTHPDQDRIRGKAARGTDRQIWDADFFPGFYYDPDKNIKSEKLEISGISGRTIGKGSLAYQTSSVPRDFQVYKHNGILVEGKGNYSVIGLGGETYAAIGGKANRIANILVDNSDGVSDKRFMVNNETWELGNGYTLTAEKVVSNLCPTCPDREIWIRDQYGYYIGQARLILKKDGRILKNETLPEGGTFIYSANFSNETNVPVFVTHIDQVWEGAAQDSAMLRYTWLMSQDVKEIKTGDSMGELEVVNASANALYLKNKNAISLDRGTTVPITGDIRIKVADSPELRYYPVIKEAAGIEESSGIMIDNSRNITISNNNILNSSFGIRLRSTRGSLLAGNNVSEGGYGIYLSSSGGNILAKNMMDDNLYNFGVTGYGADLNNRISTNNLVDGKPVYYMIGSVDTVYVPFNNPGTFYCINCVNITVIGMDLNGNGAGIFFWNTTRSRIMTVRAMNNYQGIYLVSSDNNTILGNYIMNGGIFLASSDSNTLSGNMVLNGDEYFYSSGQKNLNNCISFMPVSGSGISLALSNNNTLGGNKVSHGGISISSSDSNLISKNTVSYSESGFSLSSSTNNTLIGNTAFTNGIGIYLSYSGWNTIASNKVSMNGLFGILLDISHNNTLSGNEALDNDNGIRLRSSSNNTLFGNTVPTDHNNIVMDDASKNNVLI